MPPGDAPEVLVGYGNGMVEGIEQNGVGGLRPYAGQNQQPAAKCGRGGSRECIERAGELLVQHGHKGFECRRLAGVKAGGTNEALQLAEAQRAQAVQGERTGRAQVGKGAFDGLPGGVLREIGAQDDFKASLGRPPMLRAVCFGKPIMHGPQPLSGNGPAERPAGRGPHAKSLRERFGGVRIGCGHGCL